MKNNVLNLSQKDEIRNNAKYAYEEINEILEKIIFVGRVEILQKIELFNNLFNEFGEKPFEVKISQTEFKAIKKASKGRLFWRNRALKRAISNTEDAIQRQFFRNYQIFIVFNEKLTEYMKVINNNKYVHELMKFKGAIGKIANDYRNRRVINTEFFQSEIENIIDGIKKGVVVDDISGYCKLFNDFFEQEMDYLTLFLKSVKGAVDDYEEAERKVKERTKVPELKIEMPLTNDYL
ncbi:hypothetical protein A6V39_01940 [Candidatus Mycoplasma haematobovis]|uniref:Uncharacterized protein n=1 Tax=Candidatus Mycoplasma haematobovis TaxID=432608 RepID=A0A1A9QDW4_9MOLU|nr:hypothetical protein [Candidatus Mycoplasma haematobovis]OAL10191.1 hypothetical protein A6V39_01940 [Candidatus Mycoplasma haematobovis]